MSYSIIKCFFINQARIDPYVCEKIINDLEPLLEQIGINDINDLVGRSHKF